MTSSDSNYYDEKQSTRDNDVNWQIENGCSTQNNQDGHVPSLFTINSPATFEDGFRRTSATVKTSVSVKKEEFSIYDVRSKFKRNLLLIVISCVAFLLPFCDTVYLPSLKVIQNDLNTTETLVVLSVSIYLFMNGMFSILWGPISDRFGRRIAISVALIIFVIVSIVCIFAPNIAVLIIFRVLQGASVSATIVVGQGIVADIYRPKQRGRATGLYFLPILVGPIVGPLVGGALSEAFGWRSTFVLLSILSFVTLVAVLLLVPETHQYFAKKRFEKAICNKIIIDAVPNEKPTFDKPWKPLIYLTDLTIIPYIIVSTTTFSGLFISLTLFTSYLQQDPYNYSETMTGVLFVPAGVAMLFGSLLGGYLSDRASKIYDDERCPEGRLVPAMALAVATPTGLFIYGWTFHYKVNIAGPIIGQIILSFGQSAEMPCVFAYLTAKKQKDAAAVSATNTLVYFCGAGVGVIVAVPLQNAMGIGPLFSLVSVINVVAIAVASILVYNQIRRAKCIAVQKNDTAVMSTKYSDATVASIDGNIVINQ